MAQKFYANPQTARKEENGSVSFAPGGPFDCIGHSAKINNCPVVIGGVEVARLTCYATGPASSFFTIPACTRYKGRHIGGYITGTETGPEFRVYDRFAERFKASQPEGA